MKTAADTLPNELLTLWPKLGPSYRIVRRRDRRGGMIFIGDDEQGLFAARAVAVALRGKTVEIPVDGLTKSDFQKLVGKYLDKSTSDSVARHAGMEQLCVVIPRIDKQPKWLRESVASYCEIGSRPLMLLLTCPDLDWRDDSLRGHLYECRKKGATRRSPGQQELVKLTRPKSGVQKSLFKK